MTDTASLPPLIQQMLQPGFYPHPVMEPVNLIQTHVSYVLLTGTYVYKIKKPVNYGFLDFSTLEKRQHFSQEELRLNQRGASELYLEVLPITQVGEQFQLGGAGEAVEYAVKLLQFPQEGLFTNLHDRGELTSDLLVRLATVLAMFHQQSPSSDYIRRFGEVAKIREAIDENYEQTQKYIGIAQTAEQFEETRQYTDRLFAERKAVFDRRRDQGWIRECHGDVHLRNITLWKDTIYLFDCIEFNEPFRFVDVMFDVAYIVMDLDVRDRPDLSTLFLNTYLEQMGDWEGMQVLPLYLSRQSYVRAKVTSFLLDDPGVADAVKQEAIATARRYYQLAWSYTCSRQGGIVIMTGLSGSGKSTVARALAQRIRAIHIRSDAVRKHLGGISVEARGDASLYTPAMTQKTYDRLLELGITLAQDGYTVILDAKYDRQALRQVVRNQIEAIGLPLTILHCTAPLTVLQERVRHRTGDIADATVEVLNQQTFEPLTSEEAAVAITVDTTQDLESILARLSANLG